MKKLVTMMLAVALLAGGAQAATMFTENFSDDSPNPNMALGTGYGSPTCNTDFTGDFTITPNGDTNGRIHLGTNNTDYSGGNFTFEATVTMSGNAYAGASPFFGMGNANANGNYWGEPGSPQALMVLRPDKPNIQSRDNGAVADEQWDWDAGFVNGIHRLRMEWAVATKVATFSIDKNYTGTFSSDFSFTVDGSDNGFNSTNSQLLVGGGGGVTFDDISVIPEPATLSLITLGGLGILARRRRHV